MAERGGRERSGGFVQVMESEDISWYNDIKHIY
jgi:hypothetical protein